MPDPNQSTNPPEDPQQTPADGGGDPQPEEQNQTPADGGDPQPEPQNQSPADGGGDPQPDEPNQTPADGGDPPPDEPNQTPADGGDPPPDEPNQSSADDGDPQPDPPNQSPADGGDPDADPGLDPAGQDADAGAGSGDVGDPAPGGCDHDPNAHIGVHVADSQGNPLGDVTISVSSFSPGGSTSDGGDLDLGDVPVGSYTVMGSKDGYEAGVDSQTLEAPGGQTTLFNLTLDPAQAQLKVMVIDLDGNPVEGAAISVDDQSVGVTDSTGTLDIGKRPPDSYTVAARKDGCQPDPATQTQTAPASQVTTYQLSLNVMKITSVTQATFPSNKGRTRIGVGELVDLTCSTGSADWTMSPSSGNLSSNNGATVTYTAPAGATSVTITATANGATASITFTIVAPSGAVWKKVGGSENHSPGKVDILYNANIFILPADVSFEHVSVREKQANAVGNGCYAALIANATAGGNPVQHQHGGEGQTLTSVNAPTSDSSGSMVAQADTIGANVDNDKVCSGGWSFSIPLVYAMGPSGETQFMTVDQVVTVTPPGTITVSKGGSTATGSSAH